ncbi:hypothetical protein JCM1841_004369 [Sporobolomyces salmonicolor]
MLLLALVSTGLLASFAIAQTINSPASVTVCLPQQLTVNGGAPPYTITGQHRHPRLLGTNPRYRRYFHQLPRHELGRLQIGYRRTFDINRGFVRSQH